MNKKEELRKLLESFSKEELIEILSEQRNEDSEEETIHSIDGTKKRRRGKGKRKKRQASTPEPEGKKRATGTAKNRVCRTMPLEIKKRENKFEDFMSNAHLSVSEKAELDMASKADKQTVVNRTPRTRGSNLIDVQCMICGGEEVVSSVVVHDINRWKCNECCTTPNGQ